MSYEDWSDEEMEEVEEGSPLAASLSLDQESRTWKLEIIGPAAMLLHFMLDNTESSITHKLWTEAKFDQLIEFDLGEING